MYRVDQEKGDLYGHLGEVFSLVVGALRSWIINVSEALWVSQGPAKYEEHAIVK